MRSRFIIPFVLLGLLFHSTSYSQSSVDALRGSSDAAQGVFDQRIARQTVDTVYLEDDVDRKPEYPGGVIAMYAFLRKNLGTHDEQSDEHVGYLVVSFIVLADGRLNEIAVIHNDSPSLDKEVLHVMGSMSSWQPGMKNGQPVSVRCSLAMSWSLNPEPPSKD